MEGYKAGFDKTRLLIRHQSGKNYKKDRIAFNIRRFQRE